MDQEPKSEIKLNAIAPPDYPEVSNKYMYNILHKLHIKEGREIMVAVALEYVSGLRKRQTPEYKPHEMGETE